MVKVVSSLFLLALLITGGTVLGSGVREIGELALPVEQYGLLAHRFTEGTMLFVPDIMLGRAVETLMETRGEHALFAHVTPTLATHDVVVGNFEGSVPERHRKTPLDSLRFSVRAEYLSVLRESGFDVLSLANNHSLDFGEKGYEHTQRACEESMLLCVGHGERVGTSSVARHTVGNTVVTTLMLHGETSFTKEEVEELVTYMRETSHVQLVFVHWGDEYQSRHTARQETLAHTLIDNGIDAIIGHHPHVIQDIEEYKGRPIFYSLGNFIFDQYFDESVQEGYAVSLAFKKGTVMYKLLPYTMESRSTPRFLEGVARDAFLERYGVGEPFRNGEMTYTL